MEGYKAPSPCIFSSKKKSVPDMVNLNHWKCSIYWIQSYTLYRQVSIRKCLKIQLWVCFLQMSSHYKPTIKLFNYNQRQNIMEILCLKFPLSPYSLLRTHSIAWRNFCSLFLNIVKKVKEVETQNCSNSSFSHNLCHWLPEKNFKIKCSILQLFILHQIENMQLITHYVTILQWLATN